MIKTIRSYDKEVVHDTKKMLYRILYDTLTYNNKNEAIDDVISVLNVLSNPDYELLFQDGDLEPSALSKLFDRGLVLDRDGELFDVVCQYYDKKDALQISEMILNYKKNVIDFDVVMDVVIRHGQLSILKLLQSKGYDLKKLNTTNEYINFGKGDMKIMLFLLASGVDKNVLMKSVCATSCDLYLAKHLMQLGDIQTDDLLVRACQSDEVSKSFVEYLISIGSGINTKFDGMTSLDYIMMEDSLLDKTDQAEIADFLFYLGAEGDPVIDDLKSMDLNAICVFYGRLTSCNVKSDEVDRIGSFFDQIHRYLQNVAKDICNDRLTEEKRKLLLDDNNEQEPVWNPLLFDFSKVPLKYFMDALHLFCYQSYHKSHPYYAKVLEKYGRPNPIIYDDGRLFREVEEQLKIIFYLIHWSPKERQITQTEGERDMKRYKQALV